MSLCFPLCFHSCTCTHDVHYVPKCKSNHRVIAVITGEEEHIVSMMAYILCLSCFCDVSALCVSWISYAHLRPLTYLSTCLSVVYLSLCLSLCLSVFLSVCLSSCLSLNLSIYLSIYMYIYICYINII